MSRKKKSASAFSKERRKLLKFIGIGSAITIGQSAAAQIRINKIAEQPRVTTVGITGADAPKFITVSLLRPEDLLALELRFYNCILNGKTIQAKADPAYLVVLFQPQSMSEEAWPETSTGLETPQVPGRMILSGPSRLVFKLPAGTNLNLSNTAELLAWEKWEPVVNSRAKEPANKWSGFNGQTLHPSLGDFQRKANGANIYKPVGIKKGMTKDEKLIVSGLLFNTSPAAASGNTNIIGRIAEGMGTLTQNETAPPAELETSLEVPAMLYLSPTKSAGWKHQYKLVAVNGILKGSNRLVELWHTRMGLRSKNGILEQDISNEQKVLRALWADDAKPNHIDDVEETDPAYNQIGLTSITNKDRHQIVHESSNFMIQGFYPPPIKTNKLFLTSLGAWLDSEFVVQRSSLSKANILSGTTGKNGFNLLKWRHIETLGREHYVEIVKAGNIFPLGHEAVLIKITERKPHANTVTAANFKRELVVITEPVKDYNYKDNTGTFMNFSFSSLEMLTTVSPLLDSPKKNFYTGSGGGINKQFIITAGNKEVPFKVRGHDLDGNLVDFSLPLVFLDAEVFSDADLLGKIIGQYNSTFSTSISMTSFSGQRFSLAPKVNNGADTIFSTYDVRFGVMPYKAADELQGYLPTIASADIIEPSYQRFTGSSATVPVSLEDVLDPQNPGQVFARFSISAKVNFAGNADKTGGLAMPNFNLSGLSRVAGAIGGSVDNFKKKAVAAGDYFKTAGGLADAKIFGVFSLTDILDFVNDAQSYDLGVALQNRASRIPNFTTEETTDAFITTYKLNPKVHKLTNPDITKFANFLPASTDSFVIKTSIKNYKAKGKQPELTALSSLDNFDIGVVKAGGDYLVNIGFEKISFTVAAGVKAEIAIKMKDPAIRFGGPLSFVNEINKLIDSAGFDDPPYYDVSLTGIKCGYSQALPNLQLGAFSLSNMSLGAEVNLPFTGGPLTMGFRFCERQQPFTLTYTCFGGGGFFGMEVDLKGLRQIEAALEFGAAASLNFGVASGSVSLMAGIYFKMTFSDGQNSTQLTGYVRINGAVSVLGLITASIELYMALTYLIDKNKAYGEASLKIKVEVLFFSKTVTIHTQRTLAGSGSDPNFAMGISEKDWMDYCDAFAA